MIPTTGITQSVSRRPRRLSTTIHGEANRARTAAAGTLAASSFLLWALVTVRLLSLSLDRGLQLLSSRAPARGVQMCSKKQHDMQAANTPLAHSARGSRLSISRALRLAMHAERGSEAV
jgi:hypothetical protein